MNGDQHTCVLVAASYRLRVYVRHIDYWRSEWRSPRKTTKQKYRFAQVKVVEDTDFSDMASLGFTGEKQPLLLRHDQNQNISSNEKLTDGWPPIFWFMMKITGMFYHKTVVSDRRCVTCDMDHFERVVTKNTRRKSKFVRRLDSDNLYNLTVSYENDHGEVKVGDQRSDHGILYSDVGTNSSQSQSEKKNCKACDACWWDKHGRVQCYTEKSIGNFKLVLSKLCLFHNKWA